MLVMEKLIVLIPSGWGGVDVIEFGYIEGGLALDRGENVHISTAWCHYRSTLPVRIKVDQV